MHAMSGTLVELGRTGDLADGTMKEIDVHGRAVLLARVGDDYYAAEGRCPHMGGKLSMGKLDGTQVTCPRHQSQFDLKDGRVVRWTNWKGLKLSIAKVARSPRPLRMYPIRIEGDRIMADIPA